MLNCQAGKLMEVPSGLKDFSMVNYLGRGSTCIVLKSVTLKHGQHQKVFAMKTLDKNHPNYSALERSLKNQISIHSQLNHPHILPLNHNFQDQENFYLLMEYCPRGDLANHIRSRGALEESQVRLFGRQICEGIKYLHARNIIHRDLKPSNILLAACDLVKIADFGLAYQLDHLHSKVSTLCGTPNFMAPEVIAQRPYGLAVDIWSMGVLLLTMSSGYAPFCGMSKQAIFQNIKTTKKVAIPQNVKLSASLRDLIVKMTVANPADRLDIHAVLQHSFFLDSQPKQRGMVKSMMLLDQKRFQFEESSSLILDTTAETLNNELDLSGLKDLLIKTQRGYVQIRERQLKSKMGNLQLSIDGQSMQIRVGQKQVAKFYLFEVPDKFKHCLLYLKDLILLLKKASVARQVRGHYGLYNLLASRTHCQAHFIGKRVVHHLVQQQLVIQRQGQRIRGHPLSLLRRGQLQECEWRELMQQQRRLLGEGDWDV